nr:hypothetical protein F26D11.3 - Caenorhabditis elegans [Caenorhabditis elegans]
MFECIPISIYARPLSISFISKFLFFSHTLSRSLEVPKKIHFSRFISESPALNSFVWRITNFELSHVGVFIDFVHYQPFPVYFTVFSTNSAQKAHSLAHERRRDSSSRQFIYFLK